MASFAWSAPDQAVLCGPNEGSESGELHHTSPTLDPVLIPLSASPAIAVRACATRCKGRSTRKAPTSRAFLLWAVRGSNTRPPACKNGLGVRGHSPLVPEPA